MSTKPEFPTPVEVNGRKFFVRHDLENFKRALAGLPFIDPDEVIKLVPANQAAAELGVGRRTVGRRMAAVASRSASKSEAA